MLHPLARTTVLVTLLTLGCGGRSTHDRADTGETASGGAGEAGADSGGDAGAAVTNGGTTGGGGTGGEGASACAVVSGDYGDCEVFVGWGYDGTGCRAYSGCGCEPDCARLFASAAECAAACAAVGGCNPVVMSGRGVAGEFTEGAFCDEIIACAPESLEPTIAELLSLAGECRISEPCLGLLCRTSFNGTVTAGTWQDLCAASLLPEVTLSCYVYGP